MDYLTAAQIIIALALTGVILLQQRGVGLGAGFGGEGNFYRSRRGIERTLLFATILLSIVFFGLALYAVVQQ